MNAIFSPRVICGLALYLLLPIIVSLLAFAQLASAQAYAKPRPTPTPNAARVAAQQARAENFYRTGLGMFSAGRYADAATNFQHAL